MRVLRTFWMRRWVVAVLAMSLLPLVVADPSSGSATQASDASDAYETWLRAQIPSSPSRTASEAVERAFQRAHADAPASLEAFTRAFADAYERASRHQAAPVSLGDLFAAPGVDSAALFRTLYARSQQFGRAAVFPRLQFVTTPSSGASGRFGVAPALTSPPSLVGWLPRIVRVAARTVPLGCWIHVLSSAEPLGP